ncbi:MAG: cysteine--tRNA ligase [Clostridiales bacterium]|nr:cysteine--tRNA ligase [Clostridiales bacterium]
MKLYNSESRTIEDFKSRVEGVVDMYTCGPTVYHFAHVGNLRSYIMEDVLQRTLEYVGYKVNRVMNITDVGHLQSDGDTGEDKMLKGAERENKTVMEIAKQYTDAFKNDCERLNIRWPETVVPATGCIDEYIKIISRLIDNGFAYLSNGNVYFDSSKLKDYYRFGNQGKEDLAVGVRESVEEDLGKKNKNDFVLWFTKSKFENHALKWDSPWGVGYPGWHIECSGISHKYLGEYLDIHCGGVDNKFPHHTNEIAQTESFVGHKWCNYWFHVEHLNDKAGKMSKSKGDFLTLSKVDEMGYSPMVYRFFCLQSHYRKQLVFSEEAINSAKSAYQKLIKRISSLKNEGKEIDNQIFSEYKEKFKSAVEKDLNTALALSVVFDVLKLETNDDTKIALIKDFDYVLGLDFDKALENNEVVVDSSVDSDFEAYINEMIEKRRLAKANKDYKTADEIRNELKEKNVELIDTPQGTTFKIIS